MERALRKTLKDGAFKNVPKVRSRTMSRIKSRGNKTTELRFRLAMVRAKVRGWIVQPENVIGNPDFFFPEQKIAVFVDGCFWHGCPRCGHLPKTNPKYWELKILRNIQRDKSKRSLIHI